MDYETLYRIIFNGITDAIDCMEKDGYAMAKETLIRAQQAAEDYYISADEAPVPLHLAGLDEER
jgi:hypothetical protein